MTGWGQGWGQGWGPTPGEFREVPDFLRRLAAEMGFGAPPPRPPRPPRPQRPQPRDEEHGHGGPRRGGGPRGGGPRGDEWGQAWGGPWGKGPRHRRGSRAGRGDVRSALLALLAEEPMHGYQMIQEIGRRSGGSWRPSPGSVYPTLQQLEDEGLVRAEEHDGRRVYRLTEDGQHHVADRSAEFTDMWADMAPERDENAEEMGGLVFGVAAAFLHVMRTGSARQVEQARSVLARTRTDLYRILGDEAPTGADEDAGVDDDVDLDDDGDDGSGAARDQDVAGDEPVDLDADSGLDDGDLDDSGLDDSDIDEGGTGEDRDRP